MQSTGSQLISTTIEVRHNYPAVASCRDVREAYLGIGGSGLVYAISPSDEITSISRLPRDASQLEAEGWLFLFQTGWWDSADLERLSEATGLSAISPTYAQLAPQRWWKAYARSYLLHRDAVTAIADIGEPTDPLWVGDAEILGIETPSRHVAEDGSLLERPYGQSISKWSSPPSSRWKIQVPAEHLLPKMHVEFILRRAGRGRASAPFDELILSRGGSKFAIHGRRGMLAVPAWGTWPSPVAVNCDQFIKAARAAALPLLAISYSAKVLRIDRAWTPAREL
jgi:hypothetical protein